MRRPWSIDELILSLSLYLEQPPVLSKSDPRLARQARLQNRTPDSIWLRLQNFKSVDPDYAGLGMRGGLGQCHSIWRNWAHKPEALQIKRAEILQNLSTQSRQEPAQTFLYLANPDNFDVDSYLRTSHHSGNPISWSCNAHLSVLPGDEVYIWRSKGNQSLESGIVASCIALSEASPFEDPEALRYFKSTYKPGTRVWLLPLKVRLSPSEGMLTLDIIRSDPHLSDSILSKRLQGTNFCISGEGTLLPRLLRQYFNSFEPTSEDPAHPDSFAALEGHASMHLHLRRERSQALTKAAKEYFRANNDGKLFCEACGMNPTIVYGMKSRSIIEAHHKLPLSAIETPRVTTVHDFTMLCPSCHKAIHSFSPMPDLESFRERIRTGL